MAKSYQDDDQDSFQILHRFESQRAFPHCSLRVISTWVSDAPFSRLALVSLSVRDGASLKTNFSRPPVLFRRPTAPHVLGDRSRGIWLAALQATIHKNQQVISQREMAPAATMRRKIILFTSREQRVRRRKCPGKRRAKGRIRAQYAIAPSYLKCKLAPLVRD